MDLLFDHLSSERRRVLAVGRLQCQVPHEHIKGVGCHEDRVHLFILLVAAGIVRDKFDFHGNSSAWVPYIYAQYVQPDSALVDCSQPTRATHQRACDRALARHTSPHHEQLDREGGLWVVVQVVEVFKDARRALLFANLRGNYQLWVAREL